MNIKHPTGLAVAAAFLIGAPAFGQAIQRARGDGPRGGGHAVAAIHAATGGSALRAYPGAARSRPLGMARAYNAPAAVTVASGRSFNNSFATQGARGYGGNSTSSFGGNTYNKGNRYNSRGYGNNGGGGNQYALASRPGWNHNQQYFWGGNHYGWYNGGWYIMNPYPYYSAYGYGNYNSGASYGATTYGATTYGASTAAPESVQVQSALSQQGYYQGPIDGIIGPGTQAAISAYQQDNGLRVTGTITNGLIRDLGVS